METNDYLEETETTRFIPIPSMASNKSHSNDSSIPRSSRRTSKESRVRSVSVSEKDNKIKGNSANRARSTLSLLDTAQVQLHIFAEDVKQDFCNNKEIGINNMVDKECAIDGLNGVTFVPDPDAKANLQNNEKVRSGWKRYLGIILAVSSSMVFALGILIVKSLPQYHPYSKGFWRFQGIVLPSIFLVIYYRIVKKEKIFDSILPLSQPGHKKTALFLFLRGLCGTSALVLQFYSLHFISMADSTVIAFSTPVFVSLAASVLLGEKTGFVPVLSGVSTLFGVVIITRPPLLTGEEAYDSETLVGAGLALGCMVFAACTFLILRYLRQTHFTLITTVFGVWGSIQTLALSASVSTFQPPEGLNHWMLAVGLAVTTFVGQTLLTLAFKYETAGTVSLCRTCDVLFAFIWQFVFLGVAPDLYSLIGGIIVIAGVLVVAFRKFLSEMPDGHPSRQTFWILLK